MKRQWMLTGVSVLLCCCLFVFVPGRVFAAQDSPNSIVYKNQIIYLYPSNASSTSDADLYVAFTFSELQAFDDGGDTKVKVLTKIVLRNTTNNDLIIPSSYIQFTPTFTITGSYSNIYDIEFVEGDLIIDRVGTNGKFYVANAPEYALNSNIIVPSHGDRTLICSFVIDGLFSAVNVTWNYPAIPFTPVVVATGDALVSSYPEYLKWIYFRLNTIYDALIDNVQQGTSTDTDAGDTQTEIETVHGTEQTWYTATETALEGTGLSTFSFTGSDYRTTAMADFTALWTNMEGYVIVPTFALSLKLATTVIRHMPRRKRMSEKDD